LKNKFFKYFSALPRRPSGVVRQQFTHLPGTGNATMRWPSIGSGPTATNGAVECSSSGNVQRNANNLTQQQLNSTSSSGMSNNPKCIFQTDPVF
jgi:hypothetical protein